MDTLAANGGEYASPIQAILTSNISSYLDASKVLQILIQSTNPASAGQNAVLSTDMMQMYAWGQWNATPPSTPITISSGSYTNLWSDFGPDATSSDVSVTKPGGTSPTLWSDFGPDATSSDVSTIPSGTEVFVSNANHALPPATKLGIATASIPTDSTTHLAYQNTTATLAGAVSTYTTTDLPLRCNKIHKSDGTADDNGGEQRSTITAPAGVTVAMESSDKRQAGI
jgi:hypothetical protein